MSNGVNCVSAMTRRIEPGGTCSSSATTWVKRRADVLADFGLAGVDGDLAVLADVQPGADVLRHGLAAASAAPAAAAGRLCFGVVEQVEDQDAAAQRLQEVAPVELELISRLLAQLVALGLELESRVDEFDGSFIVGPP